MELYAICPATLWPNVKTGNITALLEKATTLWLLKKKTGGIDFLELLSPNSLSITQMLLINMVINQA